MAIGKDLKEKARMTREGRSRCGSTSLCPSDLGLLTQFAQEPSQPTDPRRGRFRLPERWWA